MENLSAQAGHLESFADVWEKIADAIPDAPAQKQGDRVVTWRDFDRGADGVAKALLDAGFTHQDKVAQYLYNCPEYLESFFGTLKAGMVPVNTNYRYGPAELVYLWDNADAVCVVFHGTFSETIDEIRAEVPKVKLWLWVDDGSHPCPDWATPYEEVASSAPERVRPPWERSGDDIIMLYTGGTTGMPKGVMWRQADLMAQYGANSQFAVSDEPPAVPGPPGVPACPIMHGTGMFVSFLVLTLGGCVVTLTKRSYDPEELLDTIEREKVSILTIVGDAFAKPMLATLDASPERWDISSLGVVVSSGVMWSGATKRGMLKHHPAMALSDHFSSSEALGMASSTSTGDTVNETAKFTLGPNTRVIREDGTDVDRGTGEVGMLAISGRGVPVGYYKDPEKTARTFREVDGERYSIPGDFAMVDEDGTVHVMGRGSVCINTGGEKVYPEEVEEVLKEHPSVRDAAVVGVPDEKWGEAITAMVEPSSGSIDEAELIAHVKSRLAAYKAPKRVLDVRTVGRSPAGKLDYTTLRRDAVERVGS